MEIKIGFFPISIIDIFDIILVSIIFYGIYLRIKDTRAMQIIIGLLILVVASLVADWANLEALSTFINFFKSVWLISIVVIFAPELRRLLIQIGTFRSIVFLTSKSEHQLIDQIVTASRVLSEKKYGALIVITRETQLGAMMPEAWGRPTLRGQGRQRTDARSSPRCR